jgi:hypothetical protein
MKRRQFVKASLVSGAVIIGIGTGTSSLIEESSKESLTLDFALKRLDELSPENVKSEGTWDLHQIFTHCAQSVEFSMSQFPEHKSSLFKNTVGKLAFSVFASYGKMSHGLNEPIPSAPVLIQSSDSMVALNRLKKSLIEFNNYQGALAPHFAYGELTKEEYEIAHVMHLYNHLQEIKS